MPCPLASSDAARRRSGDFLTLPVDPPDTVLSLLLPVLPVELVLAVLCLCLGTTTWIEDRGRNFSVK